MGNYIVFAWVAGMVLYVLNDIFASVGEMLSAFVVIGAILFGLLLFGNNLLEEQEKKESTK